MQKNIVKYFFHCFIITLFFAFSVNGQSKQADASQTILQLDEVVKLALQQNPELRAFEQRMNVAAARIPQASSLDNPELTVKVMEVPFNNLLNTGKANYRNFELMQAFPFPGKLSKAQRIAEIDAEHAIHYYQEKVLETIAQVKVAYFDLYLAQRAIEVNQENAKLLQQFAQITRTQYTVGKGTNQDVLKANVELAKLQNELLMLQQKEETAKAMLNVLLNRPPQAPLGQTEYTIEDKKTLNLEELQRLALQSRPMLKHDSLSVEQSQVSYALAKQQYLPDFKVSVEYVQSPTFFVGTTRGWSVMTGLTFPFAPWVLGKQSGKVEEAAADIEVKNAVLNNSKNMVLFSVKDAFVKVQTARRLVDLYRTVVLPQAEQSLQATVVAYQTKQTDFLSLIDNYRTLQSFKLEYYTAIVDYAKSLADLERAVGVTKYAKIEMRH